MHLYLPDIRGNRVYMLIIHYILRTITHTNSNKTYCGKNAEYETSFFQGQAAATVS